MKKLFICCITLIIPCLSFAFKTNSFKGNDTTKIALKLTTTPSHFIFLDFPVTLEKVFKKNSLGLTIAFRPATKKNGELKGGTGMWGHFADQAMNNNYHNGITTELNSKLFFTSSNRLYIDFHLMYRFWWYQNKHIKYDNSEKYSINFNGLRNENIHVYCFKVFFGNTFVFLENNKNKLVVDLFAGLSIRHKTYIAETFNGEFYNTNGLYTLKYRAEKGNTFHIIPVGGISIGLGK